MAEEVCCRRAGIDGGFAVNALEENAKLHLFRTFFIWIEGISNGAFTPNIVYQGDEPSYPFRTETTAGLRKETYDSISGVLETYYAMKLHHPHPSKSSDLRRVVNTAPNGMSKYDPAAETVKDTDKREKYRIYGELLNTYCHSCQPGDTSLKVVIIITARKSRFRSTERSAGENVVKNTSTATLKAEADLRGTRGTSLSRRKRKSTRIHQQKKSSMSGSGAADTSGRKDRQGKSRKSPPIRSTTALPRALTFMSARTTSRTRNFRLNSPPATTGGSTRKASRAAMSS